MKNHLPAILILLTTFFQLPKVTEAQLVVDSKIGKEQLVEMLVDKGVFYENVKLSCPEGAFGIFSHPTDQSNLSLGEGIILTTGLARNAIGPNFGSNKSRSHGISRKDEDLAKLSNNPKSIKDPCVLEFDVTPVGDEITFNYVFGSEEYPEYVGSKFNDVFGFFVSGPGLNGKYSKNATNIAVVKKAKKWPVAVNTINSGKQTYKDKSGKKVKKTLKQRIGKAFRRTPNFSHLYTDNSNGGGNTIQYDGFTSTLEAKVRVSPCQTYHFKLAIADLGDGSMDSGVFIEKNSFKSNTYYAETAMVEPCDSFCNGKVKLNILNGDPKDYSISWLFGNGPEKPGVLELDQICPGSDFIAMVQPKRQACKQMIRVSVPEVLSIQGTANASNSNSHCNGSIKLDVSGGLPPYTYDWSNGSTQEKLSGLCPGTYSVSVKAANGCVKEMSFLIKDEEVIKIDTNAMVSRGPAPKTVLDPLEELKNIMKEQSKILFSKGKAEVRPEDYVYLGKLSFFLKKNADIKLQLTGHASSEGSTSFNKAISLQRAEAVRKHLISTGVPKEQLEVFAKGESELFQEEKTAANRKANRRVVMRIVKE